MPLWISIICIVAAVVIGAGAGIFLGIAIRKNTAEKEIGSAEEEAKKIVADAIKTAEARKKEVVLEGKDEVHRFRNESEKEISDRRKEVQRQERRIQQKEETLDKKLDNMERKEEKVNKKLRDADAKLEEVETLKKSQFEMLEKISGYTAEQAKSYLLSQLENELAHEKSVKIMEYTEQLKEEADDKARNIISLAIQRLAAEQVSEATISVVPLPNDEMKGRIIGREGRNIRAIETLTGVDLIIDDTPEAITLSCFEPVRREIARIALEKLIADGRIHPARIEEMVEKARREVESEIKRTGERAVLDAGVHNIHPELVKLLGRLRYRTSYGQNVLDHSLEVSYIAGMMASELGLILQLLSVRVFCTISVNPLTMRLREHIFRLVSILPKSIRKATLLFTLFTLTTVMLRREQLLPVLYRRQMLFQPQDRVQEEKMLKTTLSDSRSLKRLRLLLTVLSVPLQFRQVVRLELWLSLKLSMMSV